MLDPLAVPAVEHDELLARYVFSRSHFSRGNDRIKAGAFIPAPNGELSVTRHRDASEDEIWTQGHRVAAERATTLRARGDVLAATCAGQQLTVQAAPIEDNPNHANVVGWPMGDKARIKLIAEEIAIAAKARFVDQ